MEKLIELLNERTEEKREEIWSMFSEWTLEIAKYKYDEERECITYDDYEVDDTFIIAKKTKFIQRLVDNDKIDFYTILKENWTFRKEFYAIENKKEYERLIMLLSIQDNPIEFLISILN